MFSLVLEVDDEIEPPDDEVFEKQQSSSSVTSFRDQAANFVMEDAREDARKKQRGRRSAQDTIKIVKLDRMVGNGHGKEAARTIKFLSGNPTVELTKGILHLYRSSNPEVLDTTELPTERSRMVCIIRVPNTMEIADVLRYLAPVEYGLLHVRIIGDTSPNVYMVLLRFATQDCADQFYLGFHNKPFSALEPVLCHLAFISRVEAANTRDLDVKLRYGVNELPPCAVCLERMDESITGIVTTLCNHSFHCSCLKSWKFSSCPVCRHTSKPEVANECMVCGTFEGLWICLICGFIGCGRYLDRHSYQHFVETQHTYAMELQTQRVWDYVGDSYVHRLIQSTADGKPVELRGGTVAAEEKADALNLEFTFLLTSQLESQRKFFTEQLAQCDADAKAQMARMQQRMAQVEAEHRKCVSNVRVMNRRIEEAQKELADERELSGTLAEAVRTWEKRTADAERDHKSCLAAKDAEITELTEQVRDLMFSIEARDRIEQASESDRSELQDGRIIVGTPPVGPSRRRLSNGRRR